MKFSCIFCQIIHKEISSFTIYENQLTVAFLDVSPVENGHTLVVPKKCFKTVLDLKKNFLHALAETQQEVTKILEKKLQAKGFNFLVNHNYIAGQEVPHYHLHIIPKFSKNRGYNGEHISTHKKVKLEEMWRKIVKS